MEQYAINTSANMTESLLMGSIDRPHTANTITVKTSENFIGFYSL